MSKQLDCNDVSLEKCSDCRFLTIHTFSMGGSRVTLVCDITGNEKTLKNCIKCDSEE